MTPGILVGSLAMHMANLIRIIGLYYMLARWSWFTRNMESCPTV